MRIRIAESINQQQLITEHFDHTRASSTAYQTVCTQLMKAYMILLCICSSRSIFVIFYLVLYIASLIQCIAQLLLSGSLHYSFQIQFVTVCADQISGFRCVNSVICHMPNTPSLLIATQRQQTYCVVWRDLLYTNIQNRKIYWILHVITAVLLVYCTQPCASCCKCNIYLCCVCSNCSQLQLRTTYELRVHTTRHTSILNSTCSVQFISHD